MVETGEAPRTEAYRKDAGVEAALRLANGLLTGLEATAPVPGACPLLPPVFVVGLPRSGTTLLMQLLSWAFPFTHPDNIIARFWEAPFVGVAASRSLRSGGQQPQGPDTASDYGVTADPFSPHEFGYFWTRWFRFEPSHLLGPEQLAAVDAPGLLRSLFLMEHVGNQRLLFKAVPLAFNADYLGGILPTARFLRVRRDALPVAQSVYLGRIARYGRDDVWWSLRPPGYEEHLEDDPLRQVAWQVRISERLVGESLGRIDPRRVLDVPYEELCAAPCRLLGDIGRFLGLAARPEAASLSPFTASNAPRLEAGRLRRLARLLGDREA